MKTYVYALIKKENDFLILQRPHAKKTYPSVWNLPGGKLEENETYIECVIREVREETSLKFVPFMKIFDAIDYDGGEKKVIVFIGHANDSEVILSNEHINFKFLSPQNISEYETMPYIKKLFEGMNNE